MTDTCIDSLMSNQALVTAAV